MSDNDNKKPNVSENEKNNTFEIPAEGSLGILALGAVGIKAWFKKREEVKQLQNNTKKDE